MKKTILTVLAASTLLTACGGGSGTTTSSYSASGTWIGTTTNHSLGNRIDPIRFVLSETNKQITGQAYFALENGNWSSVSHPVTGTRDTNNQGTITLTIASPVDVPLGTAAPVGTKATFNGTFSGNTFSGSYTSTAGAVGTFTTSRQ